MANNHATWLTPGAVNEVRDWVNRYEAALNDRLLRDPMLVEQRGLLRRTRDVLLTLDAYRDVVDRLAHEDWYRQAGESSPDYALHLTDQARALVNGEDTP